MPHQIINEVTKQVLTSCKGCEHWLYSDVFGYRLCDLTNIAGSTKRIPQECPKHTKDLASYA